ncbi:hypothetical protein AF332_11820 [Sporosarcina globispora]|uniref:Uncharacterized protein n=1 Tax=Sporosarcina globispora TaxID=1459 RepID=A0A0M0GDF8_SPOGL|nr:hypothetical protein [Sporosarcina globispora]KON87446.1 hypothetical protein AF332_11820 [Sporosarcina globispora]
MEMVKELSAQVHVDRATLVFVKITEMIFEIKKDRNEEYSGAKYVNSDDVLNSLNNNFKVVVLNKKDQLIHKNF